MPGPGTFFFPLAAVGAVACSALSVSKPNSPSESKKSVASFQNSNVTNLYNDTCSKCHGLNGEGGGAGTQTLNTTQKFSQDLDKPYFEAIKNGVPTAGMDSYGKTMSDEVIWALVVHIRELQAKALRAEKGPWRPDENGIYKTEKENYKVEKVIESGLKTPWAIDWLRDGSMLVTNRPGTLLIYTKDKTIKKVSNLPPIVELGQGGLMDVAVAPKGDWIYLSLSDPLADDRSKAMTKIIRGKLTIASDGATLDNQETIFRAEDQFYTSASFHFGSKIVFDKSGHVFFNVGERGGNMLAQSLDNPFGKIYRTNLDGSIPKDNPFVKESEGKPSHYAAIWSYGHRNPQGLTIDTNGNLWDTEHGPRGGDEVNLIKPGANYGWPVRAFSINYNDSPFRTPWPSSEERITSPVFRWLPSIGASGLETYSGSKFESWKGNLIAGGLSGANVDRFKMVDGKMVEREELLHGMGRVRDISIGPDGCIYVALNQPDIIIRLVPAN